jgi:hypothetical protein
LIRQHDSCARAPNRPASAGSQTDREQALTSYWSLKGRHTSNFNQRIVEVPGIGHDNLGMFTSECAA